MAKQIKTIDYDSENDIISDEATVERFNSKYIKLAQPTTVSDASIEIGSFRLYDDGTDTILHRNGGNNIILHGPNTEFQKPVRIMGGTVTNPGLGFVDEPGSGLYQGVLFGTTAINIATSGASSASFTNQTAYMNGRVMVNLAPLLTSPSYCFSQSQDTGMATAVVATTVRALGLTVSGQNHFSVCEYSPNRALIYNGLPAGTNITGINATLAIGENALTSRVPLVIQRTVDGNIVQFYKTGGTVVGTISMNATQTAIGYNTSSDYRLKKNIVNMADGLDKISMLRPIYYNWIPETDGADKTAGFLAHEVAEVCPGAVSGAKDAMIGDNPEYQGMDQSKLISLLVGAVQQLKSIVESQNARITALETLG